MPDRVVASANGYYVFECRTGSTGDTQVHYEARQGARCVERFEQLDDARRFVETVHMREEEDNYRE